MSTSSLSVEKNGKRLSLKGQSTPTASPQLKTGQRTFVLADPEAKTVRPYASLQEEDTLNIAQAFNFEAGEELQYIHCVEDRSVFNRLKGAAKDFIQKSQYFFDAKKNYVVYTNKYLHVSENSGKAFKKISLDQIVKIENLTGVTKGKDKFNWLIRCYMGVEKGEDLKTARSPRPSVTTRTVDIDLFSDSGAKFFSSKLTAVIDARENILLRNLRVDIFRREVRRHQRKGPPRRRANDLTDAKLVGWLEKAGKLNTQWRKRYFVVAGEWLFYFQTATADKQSGAIDLFPTDCFIEKADGKGELSISTIVPAPVGSRSSGVRRKFLLKITDGKDVNKERDNWVVALKGQKKELSLRINLRKLAEAGGSNSVDRERERERLTRRILGFVNGDHVTGPLQSVCHEWHDWFGGGQEIKGDQETPKLIIDIGTSVWKAGIASFDKKRPDLTFPVTPYADDNFRKAQKKRLEVSFKQVFSELKINPMDCFVFITKPFRAHPNWQKTMTGLLFDTFQFRAMHTESVPCCLAAAYDRGTLLVVDVGSKAMRVSPVVDYNYMEKVSEEFLHLSHDGPTMEILSWLCSRANKLGLTPPQATELARAIKENYVSCHLSNKKEFDEYMALHGSKPRPRTDEMKDAVVCQIGGMGGRKFKIPKYVLLRAGELLWRPKEVLKDAESSFISLPEAVMKVAESAGAEHLKILLCNIALAGGGAQMKGFTERLTFELEAIIGMKNQQVLAQTDMAATDAVRLTYSLDSNPDTLYGDIKPSIIKLKDYDDVSDLVWIGANRTAAKSPSDSADFWAPNTAYSKLDEEEDSEHDAEGSDDEEDD